mgnify:CR=1 FL=1|tara:strand:- start:249 stop:626 length:378 start_codon:yes stop_codon:yes gene_type:complete
MEQQNRKPKGYPKNTSGGLWSQDKTKDTQPDYKGRVEVTREQMAQLVQMGRNGEEPAIQLAAWMKQDGSGKVWFSIGADVYVRDATAQAPSITPAPLVAPPPPAPAAPVIPPPPSFDDFGNDGEF